MSAALAGFDFMKLLKTITKVVAIVGAALAALGSAIDATRD
ncbi:MAG: hypothetical protein ACREMZ_16285 [Gemmatimonadales bacterium]